jgi:hypothetical protein
VEACVRTGSGDRRQRPAPARRSLRRARGALGGVPVRPASPGAALSTIAKTPNTSANVPMTSVTMFQP